jgi:glutathione S-transferase
MITIFQFPRFWGLPNISPFCLKLETYLRLAKIPYKVVSTRNMGKAPKGKLPYIIDGDVTLSDSSLVIDYLKKKFGDPLDAHLTDRQKAQGLAIQRLCEEHLYWTITYSRWVDPNSIKLMKETILAKAPALIRPLILSLARSRVRKQLYQQGMGRHTPDEIYALGISDLDALANLLSSQLFLFGGEPTTYDVIVFAFLANIVFSPVNSPLKSRAILHPEFAAYCERIQQLAYPFSTTEEKDFYYQGA